jgi:outer membrane protein OmpA-like peptidoglycan-associated protein
MRTVPALSTFVAIAALSCAAAQSDVTVYPQGGQVLYDPGTGQERVVPPLLEPWQNDHHRPIRLHPPTRHHREHAAEASPSVASVPEATAPEAPRPRKVRRTAAAAPRPAAPPPAQQSAPVSGFSDFTDLITSQPAQPAAPAAPPKKAAALTPTSKKPALELRQMQPPRPAEPQRAEKPVQRASIEQPKPARSRSLGTPRDTITFAPNATDPSASAVTAVRTLAASLNASLGDSTARVQLMAYGGMRGEKSSDTRRLSLKRALVIRQLLIDDGIPSERIDVFALGGVEDDGPLDRVDVFVKG